MRSLSRERRDALSPKDVLDRLIEGNERFRNNAGLEQDLLGQLADTLDGQSPAAVILSCIDSRTSAELIFDQGIGDVFSIRLPGNILNDDVLGSLEFSCKAVGAKLVVVLGHTRCGAVKGACSGVELGHLTGLLEKIRPAVDAVSSQVDVDPGASPSADFVDRVATENVHRTVDAIPQRSAILRDMMHAGEIEIVGGLFELETGRVEFFSE